MVIWMKLKIETAGLIKPFKKHNQLKNKLLTLIHQSKHENILSVNDYFSDNIHNLDWSMIGNLPRYICSNIFVLFLRSSPS